jgi:uncharacterized protein
MNAAALTGRASHGPASVTTPLPPAPRWLSVVWVGFVTVAMLALDRLPLATWGWVVPLAAALLVAVTAPVARSVDWIRARPDVGDLALIGGLYVAVVALLRLAFVGFGTANLWGLFFSYAAALLLGVAGPLVYTVWLRRRPLRTLGLGAHNLRATLALGAALAALQFAMTLWRVELPAAVDWVPLLAMSLMVGLFEAIFFRGFIQTRLQASFGTIAGVVGAAWLYALYHVGYGMGLTEIQFLFGLGVVYAIVYRLVDNILVLWPLLIPLGSFFNNLQAGDIELPWASIAGFADIMAVMALVVWLAFRRQRHRSRLAPRTPTPQGGAP